MRNDRFPSTAAKPPSMEQRVLHHSGHQRPQLPQFHIIRLSGVAGLGEASRNGTVHGQRGERGGGTGLNFVLVSFFNKIRFGRFSFFLLSRFGTAPSLIFRGQKFAELGKPRS